MKIGDLVKLSASGSRIQSNRFYLGRIGMVLNVYDPAIENLEGERWHYRHHTYPYKVLWFASPDRKQVNDVHTRRDLKYLSKL
mgnify:CR=1 FL=1